MPHVPERETENLDDIHDGSMKHHYSLDAIEMRNMRADPIGYNRFTYVFQGLLIDYGDDDGDNDDDDSDDDKNKN